MDEKLKSPEQLPEVKGRKLAFTWDLEGEESVVPTPSSEAALYGENGRSLAPLQALLQRGQ